MTNGEKKQSPVKNLFLQILPNFELTPENKPYTAFRLILLSVAVLLIAGNWLFFDRMDNYRIGYPSPKTYFALTSARYEDKSATLELRQRAAARIIDVMVQDERIASKINQKIEQLEKKEYSKLFSPPLYELFENLSDISQKNIIDSVVNIGKKIRDEAANREQQTALIWKYLKSTTLTQADKNVAFQILDELLNPSLHSDSEMAVRLREDVSMQIPSVIREIRPGAVLIQRGQIVTPSLAKLLQSQGYPDASFPCKQLFFIIISILIWSFWPIWIEKGLKDKLTYLEWMYIAVVVSLAWTLELIFAHLGGYSMAVLGITGWLCLTLPVSISYHVIFGGGIISVMIAYGTNPAMVTLGCILSAFSAGIGRILFIDSPNHRITIWRNLFFLGLCLGAVSVCTHWGFGFYYNYTLPLSALIFSAVWGTIVIALLPLWEIMFDVISPLRLLELSHPSQPLLKRLQLEAPGTYHHTLMVGTLAEAAADKLEMNGLLVKAGAYYHDIGKLKNPRYFIENQLRGENVHDALTPFLSGLVIISHVRDGLEIAEENNLPNKLRRFIAEHHGTTLQKYFYDKAKAMNENVAEEQFRYPGPKPQSRETALVMLADSVEAAVKARNKPFESIRDLTLLVENVIRSKIEAGQLIDVDFTMKEIASIASCFVDILRSTYHSREVRNIADAVKNMQQKKEQGDKK